MVSLSVASPARLSDRSRAVISRALEIGLALARSQLIVPLLLIRMVSVAPWPVRVMRNRSGDSTSKHPARRAAAAAASATR
jgi:hypothetical protein